MAQDISFNLSPSFTPVHLQSYSILFVGNTSVMLERAQDISSPDSCAVYTPKFSTDNSDLLNPPNSSFIIGHASTPAGKVPRPRKSILSKHKIRKPLKSSSNTTKRLFIQSILKTPNKCQYNSTTIPNNSTNKPM